MQDHQIPIKLIPPEPLFSYLLKTVSQLRQTVYNLIIGVELKPYSRQRLEELLKNVDLLLEKINREIKNFNN